VGTTIVTCLAFGAGVLLIFAINLMMVDTTAGRRARLRHRLESEIEAERKNRVLESLRKKEQFEMAVAGMTDVEEKISLRERFNRLIDQSGVKIDPNRALTLVIGGSVGLGLLGEVVSGGKMAMVGLLLGAALPLGYYSVLRSRRQRKLQSQLPDVFDLMSRMLRAGRTISQSFQTVADELPRPACEEFGYAYEQQNLGLSPEAAMRDLARRTGLLELKIFVMAVMIHQQTGGNLADLLDKLADILRGRFRILGMIRSLTAEGRFQAIILLLLPPFLLGAITLVNRPYAAVLFEYPMMLIVMFSLMLLGALWMRKIINFDF